MQKQDADNSDNSVFIERFPLNWLWIGCSPISWERAMNEKQPIHGNHETEKLRLLFLI